MKRLSSVLPLAWLVFVTGAATARTSRILPWQPSGETNQIAVYHPETILFVHGINANDQAWDITDDGSNGVMR